MAVAACRILVAVGLLSCILLVDAKLGENRVGLTEFNSARYVHCITQPFAYDEYCSQPDDSRKQHLNVFLDHDPFEGIARVMGAGSACARRPNGTTAFGSASMSPLAGWDARAAVGFLSLQLFLVIASGCITWRSLCIRFAADSRQRLLPWLALFFALSIGVHGQLASSPWPMFGGDAAHTGRSLYNGPRGPAVILKWRYSTGSFQSSPAIGLDQALYLGSSDNNVYAVDGSTGELKWNFTTNESVLATPAIGADGTVYVGSLDFNMYALNGTTGELKWNFTTGGQVFSSPTIGADGVIYVGSDDGKLYALNGTTGAVKWNYITGSIWSSPAIGVDGTVYVGANDGKVYALNGATGEFKWRTIFIYAQLSPAIGADGTVYVGSFDTNVYAIDGVTGAVKWSYATGLAVQSSPAIGADGTIYIGSGDKRVYALNGATGALKWTFVTGGYVLSSPVIGADGTVYVGSFDHSLYALTGVTGALKWSYVTTGEIHGSSAIGADGTVYVSSIDGNLYALIDCPAGYYCPPASTPVSCPSGSYCSGGSRLPSPCSRGTYNPLMNSTSSTSCLACIAGSYNPSTGSSNSSACVSCPAGSFCELGAENPIPCSAGFYSPSPNAGSCLGCPGGSYNPSIGSSNVSDCVACLPSWYCPSNSSAPTACPAGSYCIANSSKPTLCPDANYCPVSSSAPTPCPAGSYCPSASPSPTSCPAGNYCPASSSFPVACSVGFYCPFSASAPTVCPAGSYCPPASSSPTACAVGTFNPSTATVSSTACTPCILGSFSDSPGSSACHPCDSGYTTSAPGATSRLLCQVRSAAPSTNNALTDRALSATLSILFSIAVAVFALWGRQRLIERSWQPYPLPNRVRKALKLSLGLASSSGFFIWEVHELLKLLKIRYGVDVWRMSEVERDRHVDCLIASIREQHKTSFREARYCYDLLPNPTRRCIRYEFVLGDFSNDADDICMYALALFPKEQRSSYPSQVVRLPSSEEISMGELGLTSSSSVTRLHREST